MKNNDKIPLLTILIRLIVYPLAVLSLIGGIVGLYSSVFEMKNDLNVAMGLIYFSIIIVAIVYFLYYDFTKILGKTNTTDKEGRNDLLDDTFE